MTVLAEVPGGRFKPVGDLSEVERVEALRITVCEPGSLCVVFNGLYDAVFPDTPNCGPAPPSANSQPTTIFKFCEVVGSLNACNKLRAHDWRVTATATPCLRG